MYTKRYQRKGENDSMQKEMSSQEALSKLAALCSRSEQCLHACREKLSKWGISTEESEKILQHLVDERYIDEHRYARFFTKDKSQLAHWGKRKIANALRLKKISEEIINEALSEIKEEGYKEQLEELLQHKCKSIKAKNSYDLKAKLFRFALSRGFESDASLRIIEKIIRTNCSMDNNFENDNEIYNA